MKLHFICELGMGVADNGQVMVMIDFTFMSFWASCW